MQELVWKQRRKDGRLKAAKLLLAYAAAWPQHAGKSELQENTLL